MHFIQSYYDILKINCRFDKNKYYGTNRKLDG